MAETAGVSSALGSRRDTVLEALAFAAERLLATDWRSAADEVLDRLLTAVEIGAGVLLELDQRRLRKIEERLVVPAQGVGRQRRECLAQFLFRVLEERELVGR